MILNISSLGANDIVAPEFIPGIRVITLIECRRYGTYSATNARMNNGTCNICGYWCHLWLAFSFCHECTDKTYTSYYSGYQLLSAVGTGHIFDEYLCT